MRQRFSERLEIDIHLIAVGVLLEISLYLVEESHDGAATVLAQLAADKIKRLNAIGAFINLRDARVAHELLHAMLGDVAVTPEDLLRHHRIGKTTVREYAFDHRRKQAHMIVCGLAFLFIFGTVRDITL